MVSRAGNIKDRIRDGGCTGGYGQGAHTTFEGGDALFQHILRGIGEAAVDVAGVGQAKTGRRMFGVMEYVGRGLVNGNGTGVGSRVCLFLSYMDLKGLEV